MLSYVYSLTLLVDAIVADEPSIAQGYDCYTDSNNQVRCSPPGQGSTSQPESSTISSSYTSPSETPTTSTFITYTPAETPTTSTFIPYTPAATLTPVTSAASEIATTLTSAQPSASTAPGDVQKLTALLNCSPCGTSDCYFYAGVGLLKPKILICYSLR